MAEKKVTGPASYFPSIEKKYGKPIEHWMKELKKVSKLAHMEQVAHLKEKFEMGHGHANAIVAVFRARSKSSNNSRLLGDSSFISLDFST
jgi:hypothetical protein